MKVPNYEKPTIERIVADAGQEGLTAVNPVAAVIVYGAVVVIVIYWLYTYTRGFRQTRKGPKLSHGPSLVILPAIGQVSDDAGRELQLSLRSGSEVSDGPVLITLPALRAH